MQKTFVVQQNSSRKSCDVLLKCVLLTLVVSDLLSNQSSKKLLLTVEQLSLIRRIGPRYRACLCGVGNLGSSTLPKIPFAEVEGIHKHTLKYHMGFKSLARKFKMAL